jgi:hypothetical protein
MDGTNSGFGSIFAYIILFVIIVWVFGGAFGGGFGGGFNRGFGGNPAQGVENWQLMFDTFKQSCDNEKANIQQVATTQYMIEQQANATQAIVNAQANITNQKLDNYAMQTLRDTLAERDRTIDKLENQIYLKDQLAPVTAQLAYIQSNMLVRPNVTGVGVACPSAAILNGLGINSLNTNCNGNSVI